MTTTESLILLNMIENLGIIRLRSLLKVYKTPQAILDNPSRDRLKTVEGIGEFVAGAIVDMVRREGGEFKQEKLKNELELIRKNNVKIVTIFDEKYPATLKQIYDPPILLYIKGNIVPEDVLAVAIVGSRRATHYGLSSAEKLAHQLAAKGVTIVSGMARGIDSAAHRGALKAKGRTIAVLGSGLGVIYPPENKKLYNQISGTGSEKRSGSGLDPGNRLLVEAGAESMAKTGPESAGLQANSVNQDGNGGGYGAVISEFPYDTIPDRSNFPKRNRIISGLSLGVVVVEAAQRSGSLITAHQALEQGREVFSIPGKIDSLSSDGTNNLIKQGAKLVQNADDILEELAPVLGRHLRSLEEKENSLPELIPQPVCQGSVTPGGIETKPSVVLKPAGLSEEEEKVYNMLSPEPLYVDDISQNTSLPANRISGILMRLELKKLLKQLPGKMFVRI